MYRVDKPVFCPECCNMTYPEIISVHAVFLGAPFKVTFTVKCDCGCTFKVYREEDASDRV